jgi:nucleoside-diphosphate-sugar epimerase
LQDLSKAVFVTGATGFIGQRLVSSLLKQNHKVRALVRPGNMPDSRIPEGCEQVAVDLTDVAGLSACIAESSAVIYAAGSVRGRNLSDFATANIDGVQALLGALGELSTPPPTLLLSSLAASRPQISDYANSKYQGEELLRKQSDLPWTILRPPAVYGPGDKEMLPILKMIRRGLLAHTGPHNQRLSLLHVDDLVNAIGHWVSAPESCLAETYAIDDGTPGGYDWKAIGEAVSDKKFRILRLPDFILKSSARVNLLFSRLFNYAPMLSPGKARELVQADWLCDNRRFCQATGWKPRLDLKQGAQQLFSTTAE